MLYAGAAVRDISPQRPMALYGYPHVERTSTGVHDPLLATVVVLRNSAAMLVLGSLDLLMIEPLYARQLRKCVAAAVGCEESAVLVSCTHTHSGPVTSRLIGWQKDPAVPSPDPRYLEFGQA
jgi:neutral ceramidase